MSKRQKKPKSWLDELKAESALPGDDFTWTDGSNYGLDGFHFDQTMNEGVENHGDESGLAGPIRPPQDTNMSALPDGLVVTHTAEDEMPSFADMATDLDAGFHLDAMLSEDEGALPMSKEAKQAAALMDLSWLDPTQEQDPERLPKELLPDRPPLNSSPELEEAWGVDRRTTGLELVPNRDKEIIEYERSIVENQESGLPGTKDDEQLADAIKMAVRRSHYGHDLVEIKRDTATLLGPDAVRAIKAMKMIEAEHGLAGKVFVRASAFPGLRNGRWADRLRRVARTARYVITNDEGVAAKLGMEMVSSVPWGEALRHYRPRLAAAGFKVASGKDPKAILRATFLAGPEQPVHDPIPKPVEQMPADTVTADEAMQAIHGAAPVQETVTKQAEQEQKARKSALVQIAKWAKAGLLSKDDARRIASSKAIPVIMVRTAAQLATAAGHTPAYDGYGSRLAQTATASREEAWTALRAAEAAAEKRAADLEVGQLAKVRVQVGKLVKAGLMTKQEAQRLLAVGKPAAELSKMASIVATQRHRSRSALPQAEPREYEGAIITEAHLATHADDVADFSADDRRVLAAAERSGIRASEFQGMLRWARRQMSEGVAGKTLTALLRARFSDPLIKAGSDLITAVREEHEGLSGHLYVDAAAYASESGTKGCETGGLQHRATPIKTVLAMPRCAACTLKNANGVCQKYGKTVVDAAPVDDPKAYQAKSLHYADASDAEVTASLFDPGEYNLGVGGGLDDIELDGPGPGELGDVLFGDGLHIE